MIAHSLASLAKPTSHGSSVVIKSNALCTALFLGFLVAWGTRYVEPPPNEAVAAFRRSRYLRLPRLPMLQNMRLRIGIRCDVLASQSHDFVYIRILCQSKHRKDNRSFHHASTVPYYADLYLFVRTCPSVVPSFVTYI